jgi:hypothetical protein
MEFPFALGTGCANWHNAVKIASGKLQLLAKAP